MAAIFALSLVPTGAFAAPDTSSESASWGDREDHTKVNRTGNATDGYLYRDEGKITLTNTKESETYEVYRIFDLLSFADESPATGAHVKGTEAYSYAIRESSGWLNFLIANGPGGKTFSLEGSSALKGLADSQISALAGDNHPYAMWSDEYDALKALIADSSTASETKTKLGEARDAIYFVIDREAVSVNVPNYDHPDNGGTDSDATKVLRVDEGYHYVRGVNAWELSDANTKQENNWSSGDDVMDYMGDTASDHKGETASRDDADGTPKGGDFTTLTNKVVQDFAQDALRYASANTVGANYVETGVGENQTTSADSYKVVVNNRTEPQSGFVPATDGTDYDGTGKVPLGYYLVGTSMGTLAALDTTNRTVDISEKNDEPTVQKKVLKKGAQAGLTTAADLVGRSDDDRKAAISAAQTAYDAAKAAWDGNQSSDNTTAYNAARDALEAAKATDSMPVWVEDTDADVGDYVQFRTVVTAQQGMRNYVLHDVMERGLTFVNTKTGDPDAAKPTNEYDYDTDATTSKYDYTLKVYLVRGDKVYYVHGKAADTSWHKNYTLATGDKQDFTVTFFDSTVDANGKDDNDRVTLQAADLSQANVNVDSTDFYNDVDVKDGDRIVVTYWARLNEKAAVFDTDAADSTTSDVKDNSNVDINDDSRVGQQTAQVPAVSDGNGRNTNSTILCYGNSSNTVWDRAEVTTYQFDLTKTETASATADEYPLLDGAKFSVYKAVGADVATTTSEGTTTVSDGYVSFQPTETGATYYYKSADKLRFKVMSDTELASDPDSLGIAAKYNNGGGDTSLADYAATHLFYRYAEDNSTGKADEQATGTTAVLEPKAAKSVHLYGLEADTYVLVEDKAPTGYNRLAHPIVVTVTGDTDNDGTKSGQAGYIDKKQVDNGSGTPIDNPAIDPAIPELYDADEGTLVIATKANSGAEVTAEEAKWNSTVKAGTSDSAKKVYDTNLGTTDAPIANGGVQVVNQTGAELPSTGGIGTTIFYVVGTVLVVGAAVMLVAKRRMGAEA